ncbi:MAG: ABC transporter ATP-binding protein [Pirellulales bacterium]
MPKLSSAAAIRFEHVTKHYYLDSPVSGGFKNLVLHMPSQIRAMRRRRPFRALDDVSFEIRAGECVSVIGPNGAGKSTTLGLIAGVLRASSGTIHTVGRVCPLLELGAGFHSELNGRENIVLNGILLGLTRREVLERVDDIIAFSELGEFIDAPLRTYSTGMVSRLGFSVAVHLDPNILLVDEALAVGDQAFRQKCLRRMQQFRDRGTTMVFVSHEMESLAQISDRVALIVAGQLVDIGEPARVIDRYRNRVLAA